MSGRQNVLEEYLRKKHPANLLMIDEIRAHFSVEGFHGVRGSMDIPNPIIAERQSPRYHPLRCPGFHGSRTEPEVREPKYSFIIFIKRDVSTFPVH